MSGPRELPWIDSGNKIDVHYKALLDNRHLGQWDLVERKTGRAIRPTVVIEAVRPYVPERRRQVKQSDGQYVPEPIKRYEVRFRGKKKTWLAGPVSLAVLSQMYGDKPVGWIGQKVTLYVDPNVMMGRKKTGGIRILNERPTEQETEDPLDNDVDRDRAGLIAEAFGEEDEGRQPGQEG
jgi:hypothetical protein